MSNSPPVWNRIPSSTAVPFLLLDENRFAFTAIRQAQRRSPLGRPPWIYLYGPSGVGKSHLARRFLRESLQAEANLRYAHVTGSEFAAQLAEASENRFIPEFLERYQHLDVLICEDLHALERRTETQRLLLSVLDQLSREGGRVLLTCRKPPGELTDTHPRLFSRCHGGVCAKIRMPVQPSRKLLIQHFAQSLQIPLSSDVAELLAEELPVSPRELFATVFQLEATARLEQSPLDLSFARQFLSREVKPPAITMPQIARAAARQFGVRVSDLRAQTRQQGLVVPRQCAMYLARELAGERFRRIADYFGKRNHSTVVHACNRFREALPEQATLRQHVEQIKQMLHSHADEPG